MNDASASARAAFRWGTTPEATEAHRQLAERVALYARLLASVFAGLYVFGALATLFASPELFWSVHAHPAKWANLALVFVGTFAWWLARRPDLPGAALLGVDAALPFTVNLMVAAVLPSAPRGYGLQFVPVLILVLVLIFRAALVPSPQLRTAVIGAVASLPTVITEYHTAIGDESLPAFLSPSLMALGTSLWCVGVTLGTTLVSREIYGLRREIAQARRLGQYALAEAHGVSLVHRDVKPANILLCRRGGRSDVVKLVDFGLVKDVGQGSSPALSRAQTLAGTPLYIAPESISDPEGVNHRVDLYAVGAVAYYLLTGSPPFEGKSVVEVCSHHLHTAPSAPSERLGQALPEALERVVLACLAKKPAERPESARALHAELVRCAGELSWTEDDATTWWLAHGDEIEKHGP